MKNLVFLFSIFFFSSLNAQNISDFKYVIIPDSFADFEDNQYRINYHLLRQMEAKKYEALKADPTTWPEEVRKNPCLALTPSLKKGKQFLKNKITVSFKDCKNKEIASYEAVSNEKEFAVGYPDAMKIALQNLQVSLPKELPYEISEISNTSILNEIKPQGNISENSWIESGIEFRNGSQTVILTEQKDGSFIVIQKNNSSIIAQLVPSSKQGIYHATIVNPEGNYNSIAFYDGKTLGIEYRITSNQFSLTQFDKIK